MTLFSAGEIPLIYFSRDRGGGLRAFAAVFHQNHQNDFGVVVGRERREPSVRVGWPARHHNLLFKLFQRLLDFTFVFAPGKQKVIDKLMRGMFLLQKLRKHPSYAKNGVVIFKTGVERFMMRRVRGID